MSYMTWWEVNTPKSKAKCQWAEDFVAELIGMGCKIHVTVEVPHPDLTCDGDGIHPVRWQFNVLIEGKEISYVLETIYPVEEGAMVYVAKGIADYWLCGED